MMGKFDKFFEGYELEADKLFGSHIKGKGMEFCLWAPHAYKVEVFTSKDGFKELFPLKKIDERGIWYTFIDDMKPLYSYRYRIYKNKDVWKDKSDPYSYRYETRPENASVMYDLDYYKFKDKKYMGKRVCDYDAPINIYEAHLGGFKKYENEFDTYKELKKDLIPYLKKMGYTHLELMPVFEYPYDGSWGYQSLGFFASTSRYGTPYDLMDLINECHNNDIGVILDVVYVHFATDDYGLVNFDFKSCYEYSDKNLADSQWGTLNFDLGSGPIISFLMSSANFFLSRYHVDGLRFDAVSNIIYYGGNKDNGINKEGISFIKRINQHLKERHPSCLLIAEDSTDFENVTKPTWLGGLGFDYKWDLGWMNDTLRYYAMDPIYRQYHHNDITFSMAYFYYERFLLPFSHDEVVHSKKTIVDKMWGSYEDKFKQCRNLFTYMYTHPGKKLNFMGNEIATIREFDEQKQLDWFLLNYPMHDSFSRLCKDLSFIYKKYPAFYRGDYNNEYFKWIDADNYSQSIYSYYRYDDNNCFVVILNMTPNQYEDYCIGVPFKGIYYELLNSEKDIYSGCNMCNFKPIYSIKKKSHNLNNSIKIRIAPFAAIIFRVKVTKEKLERYYNPITYKSKDNILSVRAKSQ